MERSRGIACMNYEKKVEKDEEKTRKTESKAESE